MNFFKLKKYIVLPLILAGLFLASNTWAQSMPAPENFATTSAPTLTEEPIIPIEGSSTPNTISPVTPKARPTVASEQRVTLTENRQTRIVNLAANISNRMDAAVIRLSTISQRLEQRIIKMEETGLETSLARESLLVANENLAMATLKLSDIDTLVNEATFSTQPQNNWRTVRERYQETSSLIRQTHFALRESITALKNPILKTQANATTSAESTPITEELISN